MIPPAACALHVESFSSSSRSRSRRGARSVLRLLSRPRQRPRPRPRGEDRVARPARAGDLTERPRLSHGRGGMLGGSSSLLLKQAIVGLANASRQWGRRRAIPRDIPHFKSSGPAPACTLIAPWSSAGGGRSSCLSPRRRGDRAARARGKWSRLAAAAHRASAAPTTYRPRRRAWRRRNRRRRHEREFGRSHCR